MDSAELWNAFQEEGDLEARDRLVSEHLKLVYHVAWKVLRGCTQEVEFDDLVSAGTIGLINAIERFDSSRGFAFSTLAAHRIRGAIYDDLRQRDVMPVSIRRKQRKLETARDDLTRSLNRDPSPEETAEELGMEIEKYWEWEELTEAARPVSIDQTMSTESDASLSYEAYLSHPDEEDIEARINSSEEVQILFEELLALDSQARVVLSLNYIKGFKLREIGEELGLSESRICQVRAKALRQLRLRMKKLREAVA